MGLPADQPNGLQADMKKGVVSEDQLVEGIGHQVPSGVGVLEGSHGCVDGIGLVTERRLGCSNYLQRVLLRGSKGICMNVRSARFPMLSRAAFG